MVGNLPTRLAQRLELLVAPSDPAASERAAKLEQTLLACVSPSDGHYLRQPPPALLDLLEQLTTVDERNAN